MYESNSNGLIECNTCGRKFNESAYEKHSRICVKVFVNKRKAFNSKDKRIIDEEQAQLMKRNKKNVQAKPPTQIKKGEEPIKAGVKMPKWKL